MLDCTHTRTSFQICVWWCFVAAKRLSGFPHMLGPQTAATLASWPIAYVSAVPAVEQLQTKLQLVPLTVFFRLTVKIKKNKKIFLLC